MSRASRRTSAAGTPVRASVRSGECGAASSRSAADAAGLPRDRVRVLEALLEDDAQHRQQQPGVGVGVDRDVLELARGLGPARVDDDDAPAARGDRVHLLLDPRRAHDAAVRDHRVRAEHEQQVGARQVGNRDEERRAVEEVARREAVRDVLRGGRVEVVRAEPVEEALHPERVRVGERAGVAHVPADRLAAVPLADRPQAAADVVERLVPADPLEASPSRRPPRGGG